MCLFVSKMEIFCVRMKRMIFMLFLAYFWLDFRHFFPWSSHTKNGSHYVNNKWHIIKLVATIYIYDGGKHQHQQFSPVCHISFSAFCYFFFYYHFFSFTNEFSTTTANHINRWLNIGWSYKKIPNGFRSLNKNK